MGNNYKELMDSATKELNPECINWEMLQSYPEYIRNDFLFQNMRVILSFMTERIRGTAQSVIGMGGLDSLDTCPSRYEPVAGDRHYTAWIHDAGKGSLRKKIYTITFTGLRVCKKGCHEVLFGAAVPVRLTSTEELFLRLIKNNDPDQLQKWLKFLKENMQLADCPWFIVQQRFCDLLDERCIPPSTGCQFSTVECYTQMRQMKLMYSVMFDEKLTPWHEQNIKIAPKLKPASWRGLALCMLICSTYNISADRLLVQDFSDFAVHADGTTISYHERIVLSHYLSASESAKKEILTKLIAENIGHQC